MAIVLGVLTLVGWQAVLAAHAWQTTQAAARTAARARLVGAPVERAALAALPDHLARRATVITGRGSAGPARVRVSVDVPRVLPGRGSFGVVSADAALGR